MIQICPAILTNSKSEFLRELSLYSKLFKQIDIDVNIDGDSFPGVTTQSVTELANECLPFAEKLAFHLMLETPEEFVTQLLQLNRRFVESTFYIHQESSFKKEFVESIPKQSRGVAVEIESDLIDLQFYNQFNEVQLMTVPIGYQGKTLSVESLEKVEQLRDIGYAGLISIDGGVSLSTASEIRKHDIGRVSVGSFFSKSENLELDKMKLELALNLQVSPN